jgi:hypothetical protein
MNRDIALQRPAIRAQRRRRPLDDVLVLDDRAGHDVRQRERLLQPLPAAALDDDFVVDLAFELFDRAVRRDRARLDSAHLLETGN